MVGTGAGDTTAVGELGEVAPGKTEVGEPEETAPSSWPAFIWLEK